MKPLIIIIMSFLAASCKDRNQVVRSHEASVVAGYKGLPMAKSLHEKFGGWSFVVGFEIGVSGDKNWQTIAHVFGRYELVYVQPISISAKSPLKIVPVGGGELFVKEMASIENDEGGGGSILYGEIHRIKGDDLQKLYESNWNFAQFGIHLKEEAPVEGIEGQKAYWDSLYPHQQQRD